MMNNKLKKKMMGIVDKLPSGKLFFAIVSALVIAVILYLVILFYLSK
jgi:hypothetical protein